MAKYDPVAEARDRLVSCALAYESAVIAATWNHTSDSKKSLSMFQDMIDENAVALVRKMMERDGAH
jgi:hypothetical protein